MRCRRKSQSSDEIVIFVVVVVVGVSTCLHRILACWCLFSPSQPSIEGLRVQHIEGDWALRVVDGVGRANGIWISGFPGVEYFQRTGFER